MKKKSPPISRRTLLGTGVAVAVSGKVALAGTQAKQEKQGVKRAFVDGLAPGFEALSEDHFTRVNSNDDTWTFKDNVIECTGRPVSVIRTKKQYTNFELVAQWMHHKPAGNSGIFVWTTPASIERLTKAGKPGLPQGIEVQVLDLAYGQPNPADWYTSHGDVFPRRCQNETLPAGRPQWLKKLPNQRTLQRRWRMEPLLCSRHQWRGSPVGQW